MENEFFKFQPPSLFFHFLFFYNDATRCGIIQMPNVKCQDVERRGTGDVHFSEMTFHDNQPKRSGKSAMNFHQVCERDPRKIMERVEEIKRCMQILAVVVAVW